VLFVLEKGPVRAFRTYVALHDGRLLTLDDTVEYFNVILGTKLTPQEKKDLALFRTDQRRNVLERTWVPFAFFEGHPFFFSSQ
jgi:hypothetical protein